MKISIFTAFLGGVVANLAAAAITATASTQIDPSTVVARQAKSAFEASHFDQASALYFQAFQLAPDNVALLFSSAYAAHQGGLFELAIERYSAFLAAERAADQKDRVARARVGLDACRAARGAQLEVQARDAAAAKGDPALAAGIYRKAFGLQPQRFDWLYAAARAYDQAGLAEDATRTYDEVVAKAPADAPERTAAAARIKQLAAIEAKRRTDAELAQRTASTPAARPGQTESAIAAAGRTPAPQGKAPPARPVPKLNWSGEATVTVTPGREVPVGLRVGPLVVEAWFLKDPPTLTQVANAAAAASIAVRPLLLVSSDSTVDVKATLRFAAVSKDARVVMQGELSEDVDAGAKEDVLSYGWKKLRLADWPTLGTLRVWAEVVEVKASGRSR